jgi:hypothetical protein
MIADCLSYTCQMELGEKAYTRLMILRIVKVAMFPHNSAL